MKLPKLLPRSLLGSGWHRRSGWSIIRLLCCTAGRIDKALSAGSVVCLVNIIVRQPRPGGIPPSSQQLFTIASVFLPSRTNKQTCREAPRKVLTEEARIAGDLELDMVMPPRKPDSFRSPARPLPEEVTMVRTATESCMGSIAKNRWQVSLWQMRRETQSGINHIGILIRD